MLAATPPRPLRLPRTRSSRSLNSPQLFQAKLRGLVRSLSNGDELASSLELHDAPGSAGGIVASGSDMGRGFLLAPEADAVRFVGPALLWASRHGARSLEVLAEADIAADLARRASLVSYPIKIWQISDTTLQPAVSRPVRSVPVLSEAEWAFASMIEEAGARPIDDHGRLVGEIDGLEVARVTVTVPDPAIDPADTEPFVELEVGVGQADRELQLLVHGQLGRPEALARAIELVREHRRPAAPMHPLNRLARERWLRSLILDQPGVLDLADVHPVPPLRPRSTLLGTVPSAALGHTLAGDPVMVVCSVGIDVDVTIEAADYRLRDAPDAKLLIVVPARDIHPAIGTQVAMVPNAQLLSIPSPWAQA